jgi:cell wall-associated NlpC family hydrolase
MRLLAPMLSVCALALASPAHAAVRGLGGWDRSDQHAVAQAGLMHVLEDQGFHGERPLAGGQLHDALEALAARLGVPAVAAPATGVSVEGFDALLAAQLGLTDVAAKVQHEAFAAGLAPPKRFGSEVVARFLGLRFNHPYPNGERLELYPTDPITRAEAAYSLSRVLAFGGWEVENARQALGERFALPRYGARQRAALRVAVARIGMPYIWGGELDGASGGLGGQLHGGYDCSGLVWRVFKLTGLVRSIRGRTAAQMAGEIPRSRRIRLDDVRPGDLLFFGPGKFWQKATERRIVHVGIALGDGWMINASSQGVYVQPLEGWRADEFSWARRVL